jgi:ribosome-binding protein aMBF1 (putative translation factor)
MRVDDQVSREILKLKQIHSLSTTDLAKLINTEESVIESLENADYEGDSFLILNIIATALKMKVKFELISA